MKCYSHSHIFASARVVLCALSLLISLSIGAQQTTVPFSSSQYYGRGTVVSPSVSATFSRSFGAISYLPIADMGVDSPVRQSSGIGGISVVPRLNENGIALPPFEVSSSSEYGVMPLAGKNPPDPDGNYNGSPLGDTLLPLCLMGMLYFLVRRKRRKALLC